MPHQIRTVAAARVLRTLGNLQSPELRATIENRLLDHLGIGIGPD
jgi:hypothetical protein